MDIDKLHTLYVQIEIARSAEWKSQAQMELLYSNAHELVLPTVHVLENQPELITKLMELLQESKVKYMSQPTEYTVKSGEVRVRNDILEVAETLGTLDPSAIEDIYVGICATLLIRKLTIQEVFSRLKPELKDLEYMSRKAQVIDVLMQPLTQVDDYIFYDSNGNSTAFFSENLDDYTPEYILKDFKLRGYTLPSCQPLPPIQENKSVGWSTYNKHVVLGGKLKEHKYTTNTQYLDIANSMTYTIETRLAEMMNPVFDDTPKIVQGRKESYHEIEDRRTQFNQLMETLTLTDQLVNSVGGMFVIPHAYDTRGRAYACAHEYNYQGVSWLKYRLVFAEGQIVKPEF